MSKFEDLYQEIIEFNKTHGWDPVPADSAKSIIIEAAELLEHFQWDETDKDTLIRSTKNWDEISLEVADILWYILTFCHKTKISPLKAIQAKLEHNEKKYPTKKFNGEHNETFYKQQKQKYREEN